DLLFRDYTTEIPVEELSGSATFLVLVFFLVIWIVLFWIAVSWHRFILLEEYPRGLFPVFRFDRILAYFGRILLLGILAIVAMIPGFIFMVGLGQSTSLIAVLIFLIWVFAVMVCFFRLSIVLPAAAVGERLTLAQAWNSTSGKTGDFVSLLVILFLFQILIQLASSVLVIIPILGAVFVLFVSMLILPMINVSILTTMYGHFIEKRDIN
ncbi:MAG: hypothetical protein AAF408_07460, partial [Pseudomonadota bacterium]